MHKNLSGLALIGRSRVVLDSLLASQNEQIQNLVHLSGKEGIKQI